MVEGRQGRHVFDADRNAVAEQRGRFGDVLRRRIGDRIRGCRVRGTGAEDDLVHGQHAPGQGGVHADRLERVHDVAVGRLSLTADLDDLAGCDLVIEAIVEELAPKQELFGELERICGGDAVLASNTSALSRNSSSRAPIIRDVVGHADPLSQPLVIHRQLRR